MTEVSLVGGQYAGLVDAIEVVSSRLYDVGRALSRVEILLVCCVVVVLVRMVLDRG